MINESLYSSKSIEWATPRAFFDRINTVYRLDVDVCATAENAKLPRFFSREMNGLAQSWVGLRCWMNPPYGHEIKQWVCKARTAELCVALLPARTDTFWFHEYVLPYAQIEFVRGRIRFESCASENATAFPAPFPSLIAVYKQGVV